MKQKILISACFLGQKVRYDGKDNLLSHPGIQTLLKENRVVSICPEVSGGLSVPRAPAEIQSGFTADDILSGRGKIVDINGQNVTEAYYKGAKKALDLTVHNNIKVAILKARSPSCGSKQVYNGQFSRQLIDGMGITAAMLINAGIHVFDEDTIDEAIAKLAQLNTNRLN